MAIFKLKSQLPASTQAEITRVQAISSAQRTTVESDFLTALDPYLYNEVLLDNSAGEIMLAKGRTLPTGDSGFSVGAMFILENADANLNAIYQNVGTSSASVWVTVGAQILAISLTSAQIKALHTTPISIVSAQGAGKVIVIDEIVLKNTFNANAFAGANAIEARYTDGSGAKVTADFPSTGFINIASGSAYSINKSLATAVVGVANAPVVLAVPTADPTAGDGAITGFVRFHVVTL